MKCAYCKENIGGESCKYDVVINDVECQIQLHYDCLKKVVGEYFSRPKNAEPSSNHYVTTVVPLDMPKTWEPKWSAGSTADCPPPDTTRVWCKTDDESSHTPWRDRVD